MFAVLWRYRVAPERRAAFEEAYGPDGVWVQLFRQANAYLGTELLKGGDGYLTIDRWSDEAAYRAFLAAHRTDYDRIDDACAGLTEDEKEIGPFEVAG